MEDLKILDDDGLLTPEVGSWGEEKYRLLSCYASMFTGSMINKWDCLVYLDLFAGAGRARIKGSNKVVNSSALIALANTPTFTKYVFCDEDLDNVKALEERIAREYPQVDASILNADANLQTEQLLRSIPRAHKGNSVLTLCLVDIFKMDNLKFSTIRALSKMYMDFLVLIPSDMDANRNEKNYLNPNNTTVDEFLGNKGWRNRWKSSDKDPRSFGQFIVHEFGNSMSEIGFTAPKLEHTVGIRNSKNRFIYRLALYSKSKIAEKFWEECMKYTNPQTGFDFS